MNSQHSLLKVLVVLLLLSALFAEEHNQQEQELGYTGGSLNYYKRNLEMDALYFKAQVDLLGPPEAKRIRKYIEGKKNVNAIEIGCGPGYFTTMLLKTFDNIDKITCFEIDDGLLAHAKKQAQQDPEVDPAKIAFKQGSIFDILNVYGENAFDFITVRLVFQHIWSYGNINEVVANLHKLLKPGGFIYVADSDGAYPDLTEGIPANITNLQTDSYPFIRGTHLSKSYRKTGRMLYKLFKNSPFKNVDFGMILTSTDTIENGKQKFYPLFEFAYVKSVIGQSAELTPERLEEAEQLAQQWINDPKGFVFLNVIGIFAEK